MAAHGAVRLLRMNANLTNILAIELLTASRGIEFRAPLTTSEPLQRVLATLRTRVTTLKEDRYMTTDIEQSAKLIEEGLATKAALDVSMPELFTPAYETLLA